MISLYEKLNHFMAGQICLAGHPKPPKTIAKRRDGRGKEETTVNDIPFLRLLWAGAGARQKTLRRAQGWQGDTPVPGEC